MNATGHPLDNLIAEAREKIARAERDLESARVELATLERARAAVGEMAGSPRRRNGKQRPTARRRSLSDKWKLVLAALTKPRHREAGATLDEIQEYCKLAGLDIERHSLRGQMFNYVKRGLLVRPQEGVFRLTAEGAQAAGLPAGVTDASPLEGEAP